jgi:ATP-dependent helicase/nuclease subunit B
MIMKSSHHSDMAVMEVGADAVPSALQQGALLLADNPRLASEWKRRLVADAAAEVIATPRIDSWLPWVMGLARNHPEMPVAFTALQELQLWEQVIGADMATRHGAVSGLARHACTAYGLLRDYRIDARELHGAGEEAEALERWMTAMQRILKREGRVLAADIPALLLPRVGSMAHVRHIMLDGFARFTPTQQALFQALQAHGVKLSVIRGGIASSGMTLSACADAEAEYRHVARRIAAGIEADAHARIAVVTSRQANDAETLRRFLDTGLLPQGQTVSSMQAVTMTGAPLATRPLVHQLLELLHLAGKGGASHADMSPLFFSPGVQGYAEEHLARALLDANLRQGNRHYLGFAPLQAMAEAGGMPQLAGVVKVLHTWETGARRAGEWVKDVHVLLQAIGFLQADVAGRNNTEIRQLNAFRECLASLAAADAVRERMAWGDFLSLLTSVCKQTPFSLPVRFPQVCVVPLELIGGLRFDTVFAIGFDEEALPLPAQPVPLLPFSLQRAHGLPGSTAAVAFAASDLLWQQLQQAAPVVHVSYARRREERDLQPSPLLAGLAAEQCDGVTEPLARSETEVFDDAPSVPLSDRERVHGGAAVIRNQSLCPFRAFATHRLDLAPLGETEPGVTAADKGALMHRALQFIWENLCSQSALLALDEAEATALIDTAVAHAWGEARIPVADSTQQFERRRMLSVLATWLELERQRPPFAVVRCEKPYELKLPAAGGLHFDVSLKADRIDRDDAGHHILIDYKTGRKQGIGKWIGVRMAEPQLPLYAVAEGLGDADAVCFARVRSGDMGFEGLSGEATGIGGITVYRGNDEEAEDWPALLIRWRQRIDALAAEFVDGRCDVAPQDAHACDYCGLEAVCRVDEIGIDRDEDGEDAP